MIAIVGKSHTRKSINQLLNCNSGQLRSDEINCFLTTEAITFFSDNAGHG